MTPTTRVVTWRGTAAIELCDGSTIAIVVPELGMLVASWIVDGVEVIARPGGLAAVRAGHTTAVPLLYPWANRLARRSYRAAGRDVNLRGVQLHTDANGLPIHGTMVARPEWTVAAAGGGRVRARFDFGADRDLLASFPFPHELEVAVAVAPGRLTVDTTVAATGGCAVPVAFGWHPYWQLPSPRRRWSLVMPKARHLTLNRSGIPTGRAEPLAAGPISLDGVGFDDLYALNDRRRIELTDGDHRLRLDLDPRYPDAQVYSPLGARFCCIEPMTAPTNALVTGDHPVVEPGTRLTAGFRATFARAVSPEPVE
ncbi:MAG: aldose 1-epimerase [Acidimicrobiia bacterium]|nr:aldose 1-epimerase [Acidimicrobiia bacterium]